MLAVSIHDVAPRHLPAVRDLRERLAAWGVSRVALLAVPRYHGDDLARCPATVAWLRRRRAAGDEIALHGFYHLEQGPIFGPWQRVRGRLWSAGEAEYLSLDRAARAARLVAGRALVEEVIDARVRGFVAPAWLEPPGLGRELSRLGFAWHETGMYLERLGADAVRVYSPVIGFATRSLVRRLAARVWARGLAAFLDTAARGARARGRPGGVVARVALHPGDLSRPDIMACAERVVRRLARDNESVVPTGVLAAFGEARSGH